MEEKTDEEFSIIYKHEKHGNIVVEDDEDLKKANNAFIIQVIFLIIFQIYISYYQLEKLKKQEIEQKEKVNSFLSEK